MKINYLLPVVLCASTLLTGCVVYDEPYVGRRVGVSVGSPYYYGDYNEYTPYYSYSGRRYYQSNGRYVYYSNRRPVYVSSLPTRSIYVTPPGFRHGRRVIRHY